MVTVQVLDKDDDMQTESDDDRMDLGVVPEISLLPRASKQQRAAL